MVGWLRPEFTSGADRISCLDKMGRNSRVWLRWVKLNQTPSAALDLASDAGAALQARRNSLQSAPSRALPLRRPPPPLPPREPPPPPCSPSVASSRAASGPLLASPSPCSQLPLRARRPAHNLPPPREWPPRRSLPRERPLPPRCSRCRPFVARRLCRRPSSGLRRHRLPCSRTAAAALLASQAPYRAPPLLPPKLTVRRHLKKKTPNFLF